MKEVCVPLFHLILLEDYLWVRFLILLPHTTYQSTVMLHSPPCHHLVHMPPLMLSSYKPRVKPLIKDETLSHLSSLRSLALSLPPPWNSPGSSATPSQPTKESHLCLRCPQCTFYLLNNGFLISLPLGFESFLISSNQLLCPPYAKNCAR